MTSRRSFLRSLGLLAAAPFIAAQVRFAAPKLPNFGDPVPIVTSGLVRMADGTLLHLDADGLSVWLIQTPDGHYHGGRAKWDPVAGAFRADKTLPTDRLWIMVENAPEPKRTDWTLLPS